MLSLRPHVETVFAAAAGASTATALVVRDAVRVPVVDSISHPTLVATLPSVGWWLSALLGGACAGALVGKWLARREATDVLYPLLLPGLANLAYVPGAISAIPFLAAFSGPLLDLLIVGGVASALWRAGDRFGGGAAPSANYVALAALATYLFVGYQVQQEVGLTGDEPHYMLIAHSLLQDHDLGVADDYAEGGFREFYDGKIGPHLAHGTPYSVHGVGLPLILLPGYALLGLTGVLLTKAFLGAVAVRELFRTVELLVADRKAALLASLVFGLTVPGLFLLTAAYPELPAAVLAVAAFRRWLAADPMGSMGAVAWGVSFGLLPLLHIKFVTLTVVFALGSLFFWSAKRWGVLLGTCAGLLSVLVFFYALTGNVNPLDSWGTQRIFWQGIPLGLAGLFFDQEAGLLPAAPIYVFALAAAVSSCRRRPELGLLVLAALGAVALPAAAHPAWPGGASAPARYLFPALPLLAAVGAAAWRWESTRGIVSWVRPLLVVSVLFAVYAATVPGQYLYLNQKDGSGRLWEALGASWDLTHYLPSLVRADPRSLVLAVIGAGLLLLVVIIQIVGRPVRLHTLGAVVLLATVAIDYLSPGRPPETASMRWMERLMWRVSEDGTDRYVSLPAARRLSYEQVVALIDVPLIRARGSSGSSGESTASLASSPIRVPAGSFVLEAARPVELELCNGEGCFSQIQVGDGFETRAALSRFHVRASSSPTGVHLRVAHLEEDFPTALQTLRLPNGAKLHALDDNVFIEPSGFWVRASHAARFALEKPAARVTVLSLANGGTENWITVRRPGDLAQFSLRPFEARRLEIPLTDGFGVIMVESEAGFRPSDLDPSSLDDRPLGVFVTARSP